MQAQKARHPRLTGVLCLLLTLALALFWPAPAAKALGVDSVSTFSIEQVYANAPALDVFVYALNDDGKPIPPELVNDAGVELTLGGKKVDTGTILMAGEPICYIFVLDDGPNLENAAFIAYKQAVMRTARTLGERDRLLLYTISGGARCRAQAGAGDTAALESCLRHLRQNKETGTQATGGLIAALTLAAADVNADFQSLPPRKAVFACTGVQALAGEPAALAGLLGDAGSKLNMALFAFAAFPKDDPLALLSAATGGRVTQVRTDEIRDAIEEKRAFLAKALEIKTAVDADMSGERMDTLTLAVPSLGSAVQVSTSVYMGHRLEKPQIASVAVRDRNHLRVTFNQPVANAGSPANYRIRSEDAWNWQVTVTDVALSSDGRTALLTTEDLYRGSYSARLHRVVSRMTTANVCGSGRTAFTVARWPADRQFYLRRFRLPAVVLLALLAALAGWGAVQRRRDRAAEAAAEAEHLLAENPAPLPGQLPRRWVTLFVRTRGSVAEARYSVMLESSLMIGSDAALCDLVLEDDRVRPQHCVLWVEGDSVLIQPLGKCPVTIGKVRIADPHRLQNNDVLTVGKTRIQLVL